MINHINQKILFGEIKIHQIYIGINQVKTHKIKYEITNFLLTFIEFI